MKLGVTDTLKAYVGSTPVVKICLDGNHLYFSPVDYTEKYLTFEIITNGLINIKTNGFIENKDILYSINNSEWKNITTGKKNGHVIHIGPFMCKDKIRFKGENTNYATSINDFINFESLDEKGNLIPESATYNISGNIMSLLYGDNFEIQQTLPECGYNFSSLFKNASCVNSDKLVLPSTVLTNYCYQNMFEGCVLLQTMPELPSLLLATGCYSNMFAGCKSLVKTTPLKATILLPYCYQLMFNNCTNLNYVKCLATDNNAYRSTHLWLQGVSDGGIFVKNPHMQWLTGRNGIPNNWEVQDTIS